MPDYNFARKVRVSSKGYISPSVTVPAGLTDIEAVISSNDWDTTTGTWSWCFDYRLPDGTWNLLIGQGHLANPDTPDLPIGIRGEKDGGYPRIGYTSPHLAGLTIRARLWASTQIVLSVDVTVT